MSNTKIVQDFIAAWEARDIDRVMCFFAEDAVYHNIPMPMMTGRAPIRKFIEGFWVPVNPCNLKPITLRNPLTAW